MTSTISQRPVVTQVTRNEPAVVAATRKPRSLPVEFVLGGMSTGAAAVITNPLETIKTRMQVQGELVRQGQGQKLYKNLFDAFYRIGKDEGIRGLQGGLGPAILYQISMNGTRLGLYEPIKRFYTSNGQSPSHLKNIASGATSGVLGAIVGSPFFLIKVRLQVQSKAAASSQTVGYQHSYKGAFSGLLEIARAEGIRGLYRGASAAMLRVGTGSAIQLSTYDATKAFVVSLAPETLTPQSISTHICSSMVTGLFATLAMNPFDVISTRMYNQPVNAQGKNAVYSNVFDAAIKITRKEGLQAFGKGFFPHWLRLGPHTILTFVFWEQLKQTADKLGY